MLENVKHLFSISQVHRAKLKSGEYLAKGQILYLTMHVINLLSCYLLLLMLISVTFKS